MVFQRNRNPDDHRLLLSELFSVNGRADFIHKMKRFVSETDLDSLSPEKLDEFETAFIWLHADDMDFTLWFGQEFLPVFKKSHREYEYWRSLDDKAKRLGEWVWRGILREDSPRFNSRGSYKISRPGV